MRIIHLGLALVFCVHSSAWAITSSGTIPEDSASEATAVERAFAFDKLGNTKSTKAPAPQKFESKIYKPMVLKGGLQLDPSCALEAERLGASTDHLKSKLNALAGRMMDRALKCRKAYPEMATYIDQMISRYRREVIRCEAPLGQKGLVEPDPKEEQNYAAYNDQKNITVTQKWLKKALGHEGLGWAPDDAGSTLFHELLHSTSCNNRHDHNEIQKIAAGTEEDKKYCDDNVTMDRVAVVESLCMGGDINSSKKTASQVISDRTNMCGTDRGCRAMFTAKGNNENGLPSKDLDNDDATRLCERIKDDGMCLHFRQTQGKTVTDANPKVKAARKKVKERLGKVLPGLENEVPLEVVKLFPDLHKRLEAVKDSSCFKRHFHLSPKDGTLSSIRTTAKTVDSDLWKNSSSAMAEHFFKLSREYSAFIGKFPPDQECGETEKEIKDVLSSLDEKITASSSFIPVRYFIKSLNDNEYPEFEELRQPDSALYRLLGKAVVEDYVSAMDKFHYDSPHFDCEASGLAPFRVMEKSKKGEVCD